MNLCLDTITTSQGAQRVSGKWLKLHPSCNLTVLLTCQVAAKRPKHDPSLPELRKRIASSAKTWKHAIREHKTWAYLNKLDAGYPESPRPRYFDVFIYIYISQSMDTFYTRQLLHQAPFTTFTLDTFYTRHLSTPDTCYTRQLLQQTTFTPGTFYAGHLLHQTPFTPDTLLHQTRVTPYTFYNKQLLHHAPFTPETSYARHLSTPDTCYTRHVLHQTLFTPDTFYTRQLLHQTPFYT